MLIAACLLLIVAVATFLRFVDLALNPGGLYMDEALEGLGAQRILHEPSYRPIFIADGGGREALFAYLVAGVFRFAGETTLALRATAAGIGVVAVVAIWMLARRFGVVPGLIASAWAAGSLWLICVSRDGMRNTLVPLFTALALASVLAWHDRPGRTTAILAGAIASAATLYTYQPLKLIPLLLVLWLVWLRRVNQPAYASMRASLVPFAAAFAVVAIPMLAAAASDPVSYFGRAAGVAFGPEAGTDLVGHVLRTLGMFAVTGDPNPRHDVAGLPLVSWPLFVVAAFGVRRLLRNSRDPAHALVLWSLPVFLLPPLIATEGGAPHFLRALGLAAPLAVTIGLGVNELRDQVQEPWGSGWARVLLLMAAAGMVILAAGSARAYLERSVADRYDAFRFDLVAMAEAARPEDTVIVDGYTATVIRFLDAQHLPEIMAPQAPIAPSRGRVFALSRDDLRAALGSDAAQRAVPAARDSAGKPTVWVVAP